MNKTKVLIVDDSAIVRQTLTTILENDPDIEVMGAASDPFYAAKIIANEVPDVITLDIEMPRMNGLTFLKKIMAQRPIPVIVISSLTQEGTETAMKALEYGAVDIITKPQMNTKKFIEESKIKICDAVKAASLAKIRRKQSISSEITVTPKYSVDVIIPNVKPAFVPKSADKIIVLGASTGGTDAIQTFLQAMPVDCPGILIVQHMPENFTRSFANRLNEICKIVVKEAENGDSVMRGKALIAPGNQHMLLNHSGNKYLVEIKTGPLVNRHRPSVDVLFRTAAQHSGCNALGIIMTGMGDDGAKGLLELKQAGAKTIAQDEKSCVVFGMPNEAIKLGAVDFILPLDEIAPNAIKIIESYHKFESGETQKK